MAGRLEVPVLYDFASTLCYVAHRVMGNLEEELERLDLDLVWRPLDLGSITGWPRGVAMTNPARENTLRVARELGVAVRMPAHWIDSREANAIALALSGNAREPTWRERVFSAIHEEGRDLDEPGVLDSLARDLSLDLEGLRGPEALAALERETAQARLAQATGVPAFVLDGWPLTGIQLPDTMLDLFERWAEKKRPRSTSP
ncbi:MAG: DsbA family protein [Deltaproteobacteria bacterium]|nr:DsbA family protein [Deltaproteobacteria bacterium]